MELFEIKNKKYQFLLVIPLSIVVSVGLLATSLLIYGSIEGGPLEFIYVMLIMSLFTLGSFAILIGVGIFCIIYTIRIIIALFNHTDKINKKIAVISLLLGTILFSAAYLNYSSNFNKSVEAFQNNTKK